MGARARIALVAAGGANYARVISESDSADLAVGVGAGQAAGYRAETVVDIPSARHTGEALALQVRHFLDLIEGRADACQERNSILPAHEIAAATQECA
jgi:hypothetical protein